MKLRVITGKKKLKKKLRKKKGLNFVFFVGVVITANYGDFF
jgi:hypothetical protein